jgi:hypothetical protein
MTRPCFQSQREVSSMSLEEWIGFLRSVPPGRLVGSLIVNCSSTDRQDRLLPFTIGMAFGMAPFLSALTHERWKALVRCPADRAVLASAGFNASTDKRRRGPVREAIVGTVGRRLGLNNSQLPSAEFYDCLGRSKFVVSPEGNGVDCHRHYEALVMGAVPIVEDSLAARTKYHGCPVVYTGCLYEDIDGAFLEYEYNSILRERFDFSALFFAAYPATMRRQIATNGAYWLQDKTAAWLLRHRHLVFVEPAKARLANLFSDDQTAPASVDLVACAPAAGRDVAGVVLEGPAVPCQCRRDDN